MGKAMLMADVVPPPLPGSLLGRDKELALIGEFLDRAARGGDAMLVIGEPGAGKTALLDAAAERATARGIQVLRASGVEFEADIPFAGLHQVLWPMAEEFEHLLCDPHRGALNVALGFRDGPAPDRLLVCNATLTLVRQVSKVRPLLIIVDDLHWLDRATAPVLGFLARRLAGTAVGFLAALRADAAGFFERTGLAELELRPLDEVTAGRLMSSRRLAGAAYLGASITGDLRQAEALLADARRDDPDPMASVETAMAASFVLLNGDGEVDAAHELDGGAVTSVIYAHTLLAFEAYLTGEWDEAQRLVAATTELCEAHGYRLLHRNADMMRAFLAAARGEAALAQALADEVIRWAAPRGARHLHAGALYACVLAALAQSDFEAAYRYATKISPAGQLASHEPYALWVMIDLVEAALRTDRAGEASAHVRAMQEADVAMISSRLALLSGAAAAMIAPDEEAIDAFDRSLAIRDAERWPFDLARVHLLYGERLRRTRETKESRVHLVAAKEIFRRLGAQTWAERAAIELRATGQTRPRTAPHDREALTPQELEIALLAATGLSNKQIGHRLFLSHRTVGAHLYRVFPKLGITSRAALRDALLHQSAG